MEMFADAEKSRAEQAIANATTEIKPFYPNPGSQSDLFFNILGFKRGAASKTITYPEEQIEDIERILEQESWELDYPEVLDTQAVINPVELPEVFNPQYSNILYRAGNRTGKTTLGAALCAEMSKMFPHHKGLITANTYDQLRDSTLTVLVEYLLAHNVPFSPWRGSVAATARSVAYTKQIVINGSLHYCRTASDFVGGEGSAQAGRGFGVGWAWLDEWLRVPTREAFDVLSTRLSEKGIAPIKLITSTINTSNPYNWGYDLFDSDERSPELKERFFSVTGSSIENRHRISETYVQEQYALMLPEMFRIEILGEYAATTTGKVYRYFERARHIKPVQIVPRATKFFAIDFNWDPACALVGQINDGQVQVFKEFYLPQSDTFQLSKAIADYCLRNQVTTINVFGDATGTQRRAESRLTNWQIVFRTMREFGVKAIARVPNQNPSVIDSVNALNTAFMNDRVLIDPSCKELIKDFMSMQWLNGKLDKRDLSRSHLQDCCRYANWQVHPLLRPPSPGAGTYS